MSILLVIVILALATLVLAFGLYFAERLARRHAGPPREHDPDCPARAVGFESAIGTLYTPEDLARGCALCRIARDQWRHRATVMPETGSLARRVG